MSLHLKNIIVGFVIYALDFLYLLPSLGWLSIRTKFSLHGAIMILRPEIPSVNRGSHRDVDLAR